LRRRIVSLARRYKRQCGVLLTPLAVWASGCAEDHEPCFGLRLEEPLEIHVINEYSAAAGYDFGLRGNRVRPFCPASLRLAPGSSLEVQVVAQEEERHQSCLSNTVAVTGGSGLELGAQASWLTFGTEDISEILHVTQVLTFEGCPGRLGISIESRTSHGADGNAFLPAPTSGYPPIILYLGFEADDRDTPACSQLLEGDWNCTDYYVVQLSRP
jgi:hypothetical protein